MRDHLVVGIRDKPLSEITDGCCSDARKGKTAIRQCEAIQDNIPLWKGDSSSDPITVDALESKAKQPDKNSRKSATMPKQCT